MTEEKEELKTRKKKNPSFFGAFFLICIGVLLLLNNLGYLSWLIWSDLFRFWPVLLIIAGIQMIFPKNFISQFLASLIGVIILGFIVILSIANFNQDFENYLRNNFPVWRKIRNSLPSPQNIRSKQRMFRCNPFDGSCEIYFR